MSLLAGLTLRIVAVAAACLVAAALWVLADTNRLVDSETAATAGHEDDFTIKADIFREYRCVHWRTPCARISHSK